MVTLKSNAHVSVLHIVVINILISTSSTSPVITMIFPPRLSFLSLGAYIEVNGEEGINIDL